MSNNLCRKCIHSINDSCTSIKLKIYKINDNDHEITYRCNDFYERPKTCPLTFYGTDTKLFPDRECRKELCMAWYPNNYAPQTGYCNLC